MNIKEENRSSNFYLVNALSVHMVIAYQDMT